jgi:alkylated DNA repair dioxygenase AlkB
MSFRPKAKSSIGGQTSKKVNGSRKAEKPPVLSITLEHGDIIVMHGCKIQQFYEVSHDIHSKS